MSTNIDKILQDLSSALKTSGVSGLSTGRGINDSATREQVIINDQGVLVGLLKVEKVLGNLLVERSINAPELRITNTASINNLTVGGKLTAETLQVKKIISDQSSDVYTAPVIFRAEQPQELDGMGFLWSEPTFTHQFIFKAESKTIFSTSHINLHRNSKYKIDGVDVIDYDRLGQRVQHSNLKTVGTLEKLRVSGDTYLGDTVYVNTNLSRLGINTDKPNAALSIVDNLVELVVGSSNDSRGFIGTWANHGLDIVTDNTKRISITGNITEFGNQNAKNSTVRIHGTLEVDTIVANVMQQNMTTVGSMQALSVAKNADIGGFFFVNSQNKQVGINTASPYGAFSVVDKEVEFAVGSTGNGRGYIGVPKNTGLDIIVNGKNRISILNNVVEFGTEKDKDTVIKINGTLVADNIVSTKTTDVFNQSITFNKTDRKGLEWISGHYFVLDETVIQSSVSVNLTTGSSYKINNVDVLTQHQLGSSVLDSNLRSVGVLSSLKVDGVSDLGSTVFVDPVNKRLGINTTTPSASLSVVSDSVEVIISSKDSAGYVGTTSAPFTLGSNGNPAVRINGNLVEFGSPTDRGTVKIHGTLEVDNFITRVEQSSPIEFNPSADTGIYAKGLLWKAPGAYKKFFLMPGPDRFHSTENIDLLAEKSYSIANKPVLSYTELGESVVSSSLTKLGILTELNVNGDVNLSDALTIKGGEITANSVIGINNGVDLLKLSSTSITTSSTKFNISLNNSPVFTVDSANTIIIGDKENTNRTISAQGKLAVNVSTPDPSVAFTVAGGMSVDGKRFANGDAPPTSGSWSKGDIMWNTNPQETGYVGWICVFSGNPGMWKPFGVIGT